MKAPIPHPSAARGGSIAIRGLLVQTLVALLDVAKPASAFTEITLEPLDRGNEKFDYVWRDSDGIHAVQVKSTENTFMPAQVNAWAEEMEREHTNEDCTLLLVGRVHPSLSEGPAGGVNLRIKNLDIPGLLNEASQGVGVLRESAGLPPRAASENQLVANALVTQLEVYSTQQRRLTRDALIALLRQWIIQAPAQEPKFDISRILKYAPAELIGREEELQLLHAAWSGEFPASLTLHGSPFTFQSRPRVLTFVALGGEGKTSLVAKWLADLAAQDWPGCDAAFAWSFYSQGTREQQAASSDLFLKEALTFFGDEAMAGSAAGAYEKGRRLAQLVGERRALLVLDGLEPLQYAPSSPTPGELKDQGIAALLKGLATKSQSLCIVTTRYSLPDLRGFWQTTAPEVKLLRLSRDAGVHLLKTLGVHGSELRTIPLKDGDEHSERVNEFEKLVEDVKGHALTLTLLGSYLRDAHEGDIRKRDLIKLEEADAEEQGGHAFRVMAAYERAFENEGDRGKRALAILRLLGLFDRPMTADCFAALLKPPPIAGLTHLIVGLTEAQLTLALTRLESAKLITKHADNTTADHSPFATRHSLDAHPLLREYFARQLREQQPDAWRAAHRRLYEHLCASTPDKPQPTLEDLQPLYQAVAHGCQAGLLNEACSDVFQQRIRRDEVQYTLQKLGAWSSDLMAIICFFDQPWSRVKSGLPNFRQAWLLNEAGFCLKALGRFGEATGPLRMSIDLRVAQPNLKEAANTAGNLAELNLELGDLSAALQAAEDAVRYADRSRDFWQALNRRATVGNTLHQLGRRDGAEANLAKAETTLTQSVPACRWLFGAQGAYYCDLILSPVEVLAWRRFLSRRGLSNRESDIVRRCIAAVSDRYKQAVMFASMGGSSLVTETLDQLNNARARFYLALLLGFHKDEGDPIHTVRDLLASTAHSARKCGDAECLPPVLLVTAWWRLMESDPAGAQADLDEAWDIAERGPMRLHMADIHLYRARLFFREKPYPWESPSADLAAAETLINECGYHRRDDELADAKRAILGEGA